MSPLTIGAWHAAELHGIAGPWTIHGHATIWAIQHHPGDTTTVTVELSAPGGTGQPGHYTYAIGSVNTLTDGRTELTHLITPQPGPSRIILSAAPECHLGNADAQHHLARSVSVLTDWQPIPTGDGPLDVSALPWLARAAQRAAEARQAGTDRNHLIRRLDAGGVARELIARTIGRHPTRIAQLRHAPCAKVSA
ncbi:hypothetical protein [Kitasatospora sp. NPDC127116]|uniref:hypothetical protein n=1 Tax=Kitasatospora sp. NPDC127116 TaxID=3345367 RepID=UPI003634B8B6